MRHQICMITLASSVLCGGAVGNSSNQQQKEIPTSKNIQVSINHFDTEFGAEEEQFLQSVMQQYHEKNVWYVEVLIKNPEGSGEWIFLDTVRYFLQAKKYDQPEDQYLVDMEHLTNQMDAYRMISGRYWMIREGEVGRVNVGIPCRYIRTSFSDTDTQALKIVGYFYHTETKNMIVREQNSHGLEKTENKQKMTLRVSQFELNKNEIALSKAAFTYCKNRL